MHGHRRLSRGWPTNDSLQSATNCLTQSLSHCLCACRTDLSYVNTTPAAGCACLTTRTVCLHGLQKEPAPPHRLVLLIPLFPVCVCVCLFRCRDLCASCSLLLRCCWCRCPMPPLRSTRAARALRSARRRAPRRRSVESRTAAPTVTQSPTATTSAAAARRRPALALRTHVRGCRAAPTALALQAPARVCAPTAIRAPLARLHPPAAAPTPSRTTRTTLALSRRPRCRTPTTSARRSHSVATRHRLRSSAAAAVACETQRLYAVYAHYHGVVWYFVLCRVPHAPAVHSPARCMETRTRPAPALRLSRPAAVQGSATS